MDYLSDLNHNSQDENMRDLAFSFKQLTDRNRDGSFATQANRQRMLSLFANQLFDQGFKQVQADNMKGRHVDTLVKCWKQEGISNATMKNRMSVLRWWAQKVGKQSIVAKDNAVYGIGNRVYVTNVSKAMVLDRAKLETIPSQFVKYALELEALFGLRREASIKFQVDYADKGDHLLLKPSWNKGGKEIIVPIKNEQQRALLDKIRVFAGRGSLIPPDKNYHRHLKVFERQCNNAGIHGVHGLRHQYAQVRYEELTGRLAPATGGKTAKELTPEEKKQDYAARLKISIELGHMREQIVAVYLGR